MSFATDLASLKTAINSFGDLIKNKFLTMIPASDKGALNGVAPLVNGLVPAQYLPSFVDDVLEFNGVASFPAVGESGKLYVDISSSGGFNTSPFIASGSTVTAFPTGDANLSESLNNVTGQLQYGNTGSTPYKFALLFAMAAGQSIPVRVTVTNMVSTGPNWNYIGAGSLTTFQSASSSGLTNVTNGQQYTFTISDVNPYLIFRGDYPSDILRTVDVLIETQVSGSWVPLTSAVPGTGNCYRWTGSAYLQINNHVGNADVATKLSTARTISASGDASWSVTFDGSGNATAVLTLANTGVVAGQYPKVNVNSKGLITGGSALAASDIPNLDWSKITSGKPTTLAGYGITDAVALGSVVPLIAGVAAVGTATTAAHADHVHPAQTTITGNAGTASALAAARTISMTGDGTWSTSFDGSGNVTGVMTLANVVTAGTAAKVTYNSKGLITGSASLVAADIPNLDWSKITSGKPTTLSGYGITMTSSDVTTALGYTPVIQGGASHDGSSVVRIGWSVTNLVLQVNGNNYAQNWPINITGNANSATTAGTATTANSTATGNSFQMGSLGVGTPASGTVGEIRATNNITGYYSDERLKERVGGIDNALEKLKQLTGFLYVENDLARSFGFDSGRTMVGMSAQEIQKVQPEAVFPAPFDITQLEDGTEVSKTGANYLTVQYERLMPLVIEAIKELSEEVQAIKKSLG